MGKRRRRARQASMWIPTSDLPRSAAHPFYRRLNRILDEAGFDAFVEAQCTKFYAPAYGAKKRPRLGRCWSSLPSSLRLCRLRCRSSSSRSLAG